MAIAIKTTEKFARQDTFRVAPQDVQKGRNSRMIPAPNYDETVEKLAVSIFKHGQLQAAEVRRVSENALELVDGSTRHDAVVKLRAGFTAIDPDTGDTAEFKDEKATLWVKVTDLDADEAFIHSIKANLDREDTTDLQDALAQNELRTTLGWTDTKIARFYGKSNQNRVADLEKLLRLPNDVQLRVHRKELALSNALLTLDLTDEERADIITRAETDGGKVSGPALKQLLRDLYAKKEEGKAADKSPEAPEGAEGGVEADESEGEGESKGKKPALKRNVKDFERFIAEAKTDPTLLSDKAMKLADTLLKWFKNQRRDDYLRHAFLEATE